jgi:hypothetical protein
MLTISRDDILNRLRADNPWWAGPIDPARVPYS